MFADRTTVRSVERAEAAVTRSLVKGLVGSVGLPNAFLCELDLGVAAYVRPGSPLNKLLGVGLEGPIDELALGAIERAFHCENELVRVELATLAAPETCMQLSMRGYRLQGFENVLARRIDRSVPSRNAGIRVERVSPATLPLFREAVCEGVASPDGTGVVAERLSRGAIETAIDDSLVATDFVRYVAYLGDALAGGASMRLDDGVAVFTGSATLPAHRRRGVQASLLATRLNDAHALGAELAIITTAPGTQSQANVMKRGFS